MSKAPTIAEEIEDEDILRERDLEFEESRAAQIEEADEESAEEAIWKARKRANLEKFEIDWADTYRLGLRHGTDQIIQRVHGSFWKGYWRGYWAGAGITVLAGFLGGIINHFAS